MNHVFKKLQDQRFTGLTGDSQEGSPNVDQVTACVQMLFNDLKIHKWFQGSNMFPRGGSYKKVLYDKKIHKYYKNGNSFISMENLKI